MEEDFEGVYKKYYSIVYRYLISLTKNQSLAEEIAQETFYKALKNIDKYNPDMKMLTWLCAIAKNTYFSELKKSSRHQNLGDNLEDTKKSVVDQLIDSETNIEILKIIHSLEEPYKEVFTLRTFGSLSFRQIGEVFEKTETWARVTYYRGKNKIKEKLDYDKL